MLHSLEYGWNLPSSVDKAFLRLFSDYSRKQENYGTIWSMALSSKDPVAALGLWEAPSAHGYSRESGCASGAVRVWAHDVAVDNDTTEHLQSPEGERWHAFSLISTSHAVVATKKGNVFLWSRGVGDSCRSSCLNVLKCDLKQLYHHDEGAKSGRCELSVEPQSGLIAVIRYVTNAAKDYSLCFSTNGKVVFLQKDEAFEPVTLDAHDKAVLFSTWERTDADAAHLFTASAVLTSSRQYDNDYALGWGSAMLEGADSYGSFRASLYSTGTKRRICAGCSRCQRHQFIAG